MSRFRFWRKYGGKQTGGTTPVFSAVPTITGTAGGTLTAHSANPTHAASKSFQWNVGFFPVSTGTTFDGSLIANAGSVTVAEIAIGSTGIVVTSMSAAFDNGSPQTLEATEPFDSATSNNQIYSTITSPGPVFTMMGGGGATEQNKYVVGTTGAKFLKNSTGLVVQTVSGKNSFAVAIYDHDIGVNQRVEMSCLKATTGNTPQKAILWYSDEFNYLYFDRSNTTVSQLRMVVGGVDTQVNTVLTGLGSSYSWTAPRMASYTSTYNLAVEVIGDLFTAYEKVDSDTTWTKIPISSGSNSFDSISLTQLVTSLGVTRAGRTGVRVGSSTGGVDAVRIYSFSDPLTVVSIAPTSANNSPILTINLVYSGVTDPTGFDVAVITPDGRTVMARKAATVVSLGGGGASITVTDTLLRAVEGDAVYVQVWKTGPGLSGNEGGAAPLTMPAFQTVFPYRQGINESDTKSDAVDAFTDLFQSAQWRQGTDGGLTSLDAGVTFNRYGLPTAWGATKPGGFTLMVKQPQFSGPDQAGTYIITYPTSMTLTSNADAPLDTIGLPAGQKRYTRGTTSTTWPELYFTGASPFGSTDQISIIKEGANPALMGSATAIQGYSDLGKTLRMMTPRKTNVSFYYFEDDLTSTRYTTAAELLTGPASTQPTSIEQQVAACNQAGVDLFYNARHTDGEDVWRRHAAYAAAHLNSGLIAEVEHSNETWNSGFTSQYYGLALEGARLGLCEPGATAFSFATPITNIHHNTPGAFHNSSSSNFFIPAGDYIFCLPSGFGMTVLQAVKDNPVNTPFNAGSLPNADWRVKYLNNDLTSYAHPRSQANRSERLFKIWEEEFAAAGRARPLRILAWQKNNVLSANVKTMLEFGTQRAGAPMLRTLLDKYMVAPYYKAVGAGDNIGNYAADYTTPTYAHNWTAAEKNHINDVDKTAFYTAFFNMVNDAVDFELDRISDLKQDLAVYLFAAGMSPDAIELGSYEAYWHVQFWNWPTTPTNYATAMNAELAPLIRSQQFADALKRYVQGLATRVGGTHVMFNRLESLPTSRSDGANLANAAQSWSIQELETDNTSSNKRYTVLKNAKNGIFT